MQVMALGRHDEHALTVSILIRKKWHNRLKWSPLLAITDIVRAEYHFLQTMEGTSTERGPKD